MKKEEFLKLGLEESLAEKCAEAWGNAMAGYVPKVEHETAQRENEQLSAEVSERDKQLEGLKKAAGDTEGLKERIEALQQENREKEAAHAKEIHQIKVDSAISAALVKARALNEKAARALLEINPEQAEFDEKGNLKGLEESIKELMAAENSKFLFAAGVKPMFRGVMPAETGREDPDKQVDTSTMNYDELCAYLEENPDAANDNGEGF